MGKMHIKIRELEGSDFSGVFALAAGIYAENPKATFFSAEPTRETFDSIFGEKRRGAEGGYAVDVVAVYGSRVIGECDIAEKRPGVGVLGIIISKRYRRRGAGRMLLDAASAKARGMGMVMLEACVDRENAAATAFFYNNGFEKAEGGAGSSTMTFRKRIR